MRAQRFERDAAAAKLGGVKRLGEISPNEFKQFIGKEMRLSQVEYAPKPDSNVSTFCRG